MKIEMKNGKKIISISAKDCFDGVDRWLIDQARPIGPTDRDKIRVATIGRLNPSTKIIDVWGNEKRMSNIFAVVCNKRQLMEE